MGGFNFQERKDIEKVLEMIRQRTPRQLLPSVGTVAPTRLTEGFIYRTPSGGIPARSGTTCGTAECTPYYIDDTGDLVELKDDDGASQTHTIYHVGISAVTGSAYIQCKRVFEKLVIDMEDCG